MYEWSKLSLKERDMTEFYVHEQSLRLESSAFITGKVVLTETVKRCIVIMADIRYNLVTRQNLNLRKHKNH